MPGPGAVEKRAVFPPLTGAGAKATAPWTAHMANNAFAMIFMVLLFISLTTIVVKPREA